MSVFGPRPKSYFFGTAVTVCALIGYIDYCKDGSTPLLNLLHTKIIFLPFSSDRLPTKPVVSFCNCNCTLRDSLSLVKKSGQDHYQDKDYVQTIIEPTLLPPRRVNELVSIKVLKENLNLDEGGLAYLEHVSLSRYYSCKPSKFLLLPSHTSTERRCNKRRFLDQQSPIVALVSFHGSGNTWVRHLIEQATGIFTGSIYCDPGLKVAFPGESVISGNVIVTKTHMSDSVELPDDIRIFTGKTYYDKAILLVRNPYDALVSEANRRWNSKHSINHHLGVAAETAFISNSKWDWLVEYKGATWAFLLHTWLTQEKLPVLVVQYEALIDHTEHELTRILKFLNFSTTNSSVKCAVENGDGIFKRTKHLDFNPYSTENREALNRYIRQAAPILAQYGIVYDLK